MIQPPPAVSCCQKQLNKDATSLKSLSLHHKKSVTEVNEPKKAPREQIAPRFAV